MGKANMYSFSKWLMIGLSLLVIASAFGQLPLASSAPDVSDYDLTDEEEAEQYDDDVDSYATQISVFGALASILQTGSLTLLAYAFVREAQEETGQHVAMRITLILGAVVLITSIVGRSFSLF